jgi:hypothetical protein
MFSVHWYLAIICQPDLTLRKPIPQRISTPRTRSRKSNPLPCTKASGSVNYSENISLSTPLAIKESSADKFYRPVRPQLSPEITQQEVETLPDSILHCSLEDSLSTSLNDSESSMELVYPSHPPEDLNTKSRAASPQPEIDGPMDDRNET